MPIYEFKCVVCSLEFEVLVRRAGEEISCPECHSPNCERKLSVFGFSTGHSFVSSAPGGGKCDGCATHNCSGCK